MCSFYTAAVANDYKLPGWRHHWVIIIQINMVSGVWLSWLLYLEDQRSGEGVVEGESLSGGSGDSSSSCCWQNSAPLHCSTQGPTLLLASAGGNSWIFQATCVSWFTELSFHTHPGKTVSLIIFFGLVTPPLSCFSSLSTLLLFWSAGLTAQDWSIWTSILF